MGVELPVPETYLVLETYLECADKAGADYLITGNQKHFPQFWKKIKIITSREFISLAAPHLSS
jgi:uncharacterized protein